MCNEIPGLEVLQDLQQQLVEQQDENIKQQQKINNLIKLVENLREGVNSKLERLLKGYEK